MTAPLTATQLAEIRAAFQPTYQDLGGDVGWGYSPVPSQVTVEGYNVIDTGSGYWAWLDVPAWDTADGVVNYNGRTYDAFDYSGNWKGTGTMAGISKDSFFKTWGPFAMVAGGFAAALTGLAATAGATALGSGGGSGAFLGEGVASGVPAWDAAATSAGLDITGGGFITETAASALGGSNAPALASATTAASTAAPIVGTLAPMAGAIAKVGAVVGPLLGLTNAGGTPGTSSQPTAYAGTTASAQPLPVLGLAVVGLLVFALVKK